MAKFTSFNVFGVFKDKPKKKSEMIQEKQTDKDKEKK